MLERDTETVIAHGDADPVIGSGEVDLDLAAVGAELDAVVEQVRNHLLDAERIKVSDDGAAGGTAYRERARAGPGCDKGNGVFDDVDDVGWLAIQDKAT